MPETIINGYLISKSNFQIFDEIVTFLTENDEKIVCLSVGSRKIESKNGRNLFLGNLNEFQIFRSRDQSKISRLKKTIAIDTVDYQLQNETNFILLNECIDKIPPHTKYTFSFYKWCLSTIKEQKFSSLLLTLIILIKYCKLLGIHLEVNSCVLCGNKKLKTISFAKHGMLCTNCFNPVQDKTFNIHISKLIHFLFNNQFEHLDEYSDYFLITIDMLNDYIHENSGICLTTKQT